MKSLVQMALCCAGPCGTVLYDFSGARRGEVRCGGAGRGVSWLNWFQRRY